MNIGEDDSQTRGMVGLEIDLDSVGSSIGNKRKRNTYSDVWKYFDKNEIIEGEKRTCFCKKCKRKYIFGDKYGTNNLRRHVKKCYGQNVEDIHRGTFSQTKYRDLMTKAIIRHNLPFNFVQYESIRELVSYLNDEVVHLSRNTLRSDVIKLYENEKVKLKDFLNSCSGRMSITSDLWTSINTDGYISLTAHFIDNEWNLQKRLLSFCLLPPPHSGSAIFGSFLEVFYNATRLFSGTNYPTANLFFPEIFMVHFTLKKTLDGDDFMSSMARDMFKKFDKYWKEFSVFLSIACIFDPRYKVNFVRFSYQRLYGNTIEFEKVKRKLEELFFEYSRKVQEESPMETNATKDTESSHSFTGPYSQEREDMLEQFDSYQDSEFVGNSTRSELHSYLSDGLVDRKIEFDILSYWKSQQYQYPILSLMAKDILAVPITTVASESAFSIGGRVLDDYRSSLKEDAVEALLCTRDWLYGGTIVPSVEDITEDITKLHSQEEEALIHSVRSN